jgi:hypothetical protein
MFDKYSRTICGSVLPLILTRTSGVIPEFTGRVHYDITAFVGFSRGRLSV